MTGVAERAAALAGGTLVEASRLSGGSLSAVMWLRLGDGRVLIAKHIPKLIAKHLEPNGGATPHAEADMLRAITVTGAPTPDVVGVADDLLVMEAVAADGRLGGAAWASLAAALGRLHAPTDEAYGWPSDHAFGAVAILNARADDWALFWAERRLRCHAPHVDAALARRLDALADRLDERLPGRPPSVLLHGDLWGGNVLVSGGAVTALIDPACYYGHREVDVAMLTMFDHPPQTFFDALGLEAGWRERLPIYRLWPLLVHLRLFGSGYRAHVCDTLDRLGA